MVQIGSHQYPAMERVIFGKDAASALVEEAARLGARRVFLIASRTLNTKTDEIQKIRDALGARYAATFDGVPQHTTRASAVAAAAEAIDTKADLIVSIGGGSVVDAAKIAVMCIEHDIRDELGLDGFRDGLNAARCSSGPVSSSTPAKCCYSDDPLRRRIQRRVACDGHATQAQADLLSPTDDAGVDHPRPADHTPYARTLWLGSGTRAMDHGIEAVCSVNGNPLVESVCLRGLRYLHDGLLGMRVNPDDLEARQSCQLGSWMSAFGLQCRVLMGASHAIGHVLGGTCDVPHYFCTAVMMPSVLRFNESATVDAQKKLAEAWHAPEVNPGETFARFIKRLGLPTRLSEVGVTEEKFDLIGQNAMLSVFTRSNPRTIKGPEDIVEILRLAA